MLCHGGQQILHQPYTPPPCPLDSPTTSQNICDCAPPQAAGASPATRPRVGTHTHTHTHTQSHTHTHVHTLTPALPPTHRYRMSWGVASGSRSLTSRSISRPSSFPLRSASYASNMAEKRTLLVFRYPSRAANRAAVWVGASACVCVFVGAGAGLCVYLCVFR